MRRAAILFLLVCLVPLPAWSGEAVEITDPTHTRVAVKKHPKTGRPYVTILPGNAPVEDAVVFDPRPADTAQDPVARPDYRLLDWKRKDGEIPYEGPSSDRTKVYVLAATLATVGVVSGVAVIAAAPAAAAGASGGAGAGVYAAGGAAVAAGTVSTALEAGRPDPSDKNYDHWWQSKAETFQKTTQASTKES
ncbi:MAG: hypothetical protein WC352_07615 [Candidatus Omnitrophota bacterium]|jgi:hypothetical protein